MDNLTRTLTIFEGPDGSGKSTAAKKYAEETGARYVHFAAMPRVGSGLARMYVEAMLPALLGYQDVVFDRCWLSEGPYGVVFREGADRLGVASKRILERLAMRCGAVVVRCDPGWLAVRDSYMARKHLEMLKDTDQLRRVWELYGEESTALPTAYYDYTSQAGLQLPERMSAHPLDFGTAGNLNGPDGVLIVGEDFAERKNDDPFYQWPFASFSKMGCSQWLTEKLECAGISENRLLWINSDDRGLGKIAQAYDDDNIAALGTAASERLSDLGVGHRQFPHPQSWKRFNQNKTYPLINYLSRRNHV